MAPAAVSRGRRRAATKSASLSPDDGTDELQASLSDQDDEPVVRYPKRRLVRGRPSKAATSGSDDDEDDGSDGGESMPTRKKVAVESETRPRMFMVAVEGTFVILIVSPLSRCRLVSPPSLHACLQFSETFF